MQIIPARWRPLVIGSAVLGAVILAFGYLGEDEGTGNDESAVIPLILVLVVSGVVAYLLWRKFGSQRTGEAAAKPALVIGIVSLILAFFYWTGLVYFVSPVGVALGAAAAPDTRGRAGMVLSALSLVAALVIGVLDAVL